MIEFLVYLALSMFGASQLCILFPGGVNNGQEEDYHTLLVSFCFYAMSFLSCFYLLKALKGTI